MTARRRVGPRGLRDAAPWVRRAAAVLGVVVLVLTVVTIYVQAQASQRALTIAQWEDCRIDAVTRSGVTDEFIGYVLATNETLRQSRDQAAAAAARDQLTRQLRDLQATRAEAARDQAECGPKP